VSSMLEGAQLNLEWRKSEQLAGAVVVMMA
jgi:hypothetical protein